MGGDHFIYPKMSPKEARLEMDYVGEIAVRCQRTRSDLKLMGLSLASPRLKMMMTKSLLTDQKVTNVRRINKFIGNVKTPTTLLVLTFACPIPQRVTLAYSSYPVRPFIPSPLQCSNRFRIGHTKNHCRFEARCGSYGGLPHMDSICDKEANCLTCNQSDHASGSRLCPVYIQHQQVIRLTS